MDGTGMVYDIIIIVLQLLQCMMQAMCILRVILNWLYILWSHYCFDSNNNYYFYFQKGRKYNSPV